MENKHNKVLNLVDRVIALHRGHMTGKIPTSDASQKDLMVLLEDIRKTLTEMHEDMKGMKGMKGMKKGEDMEDMDRGNKNWYD